MASRDSKSLQALAERPPQESDAQPPARSTAPAPAGGDLQQLYRPIALTEPNRLVFPPPWAGHIPFAFWIIDALRPASLVELGTHSGNSYCAFLQAIVQCGLSTACYAVDTWEGDSHAGHYGDDIYNHLREHHDALYGGFSRLLRMRFDEALGYFPDGSIDLLHIDGLHTYEAVSQDFRDWLPKMSERGLVLMHDTNVRERDFGVWQVWEDVRAKYPSFSFLHSNGLGVAWVGKPEAMPEALRWLFDTAGDPDRLALARHHFDRLGQGILDRFWAEHRATVIAELNRHADALSAQVADRESTIGTLENWVTNRDDTIGQLRTHIETVEKARQEEVTSIVNQYTTEIQKIGAALEAEHSARKAEVNHLLDVVTERDQHLAAAAAHIEALANELAAVRADVAHKEQRLEALYRSTSWRLTGGLRWLSRRSQGSTSKARFIIGIARRALPMLLADPANTKRMLSSLRRDGLRPTWRRIIQKVRRQEEPPPAPVALPAPVFPEVARPVDLDHSVAVPFAYGPALPDPAPSVAVVCHLFHENLAVEFRRYFSNIPTAFDVFLSTDTPFKKAVIEKAFAGWNRGRVEVRVTPNRGRDVAPKLLGFRDVYDRYELVLHLHSKQSDHASVLANWRGFLLENMLGSPEIVTSILAAFAAQPKLGMIASQHFEPVRHWINWGNNFPFAKALADRMGFPLEEAQTLDFPSGSMFWARSAALKPLLDLDLSYQDFAEESGQIDGTTAHAIERLYYHVCEKAGFDWIKVAQPELFERTPAIARITSPADLDRFVMEHAIRLTGGNAPPPRTVHPTPIAEPAAALIDRRSAVALGLGQPIDPATAVFVGIVTYNNDVHAVRRIVESTRLALETAGLATEGRILVIDNGEPTDAMTAGDPAISRLPSAGNVGFGAGHNRLMAEAFARGAQHYIAANPDGAFHPDAIAALVRMMRAQQDRALIEALQFPVEHPKVSDPFTFETPWLSGACLMIPRAAYEEIGGFDDAFFMYCEDVDLSWRARAAGFILRTCPAALFLHEVTNRPRNPKVLRMIFESGVLLARKWNAPAFESWLADELRALGHGLPDARPAPVPADWRRYADFEHHFSFAKTRW